MQANAGFSRDANHVPITKTGLVVSSSETFAGTGTLHIPLFSLTGTVEVVSLWGVVTTALGSNVTAAYFRLWDQTTASDISLNTGTTLSGYGIGSLLSRTSVATVALTGTKSDQGRVQDPVAATAPDCFMPFIINQKTGSIKTEIEFVYTTNNTSAGAITFYAGFIPVSPDGNLSVSTTAIY
jgi:hypothetical protein